MADKRIVKSVQQYLKEVRQKGIPVKYGVLFGSDARGQEHEWSDIDLLVVSPLYDKHRTYRDIVKLWRIAAQTDFRIEPIPVGEKPLENDKDSMIVVIARRDGQIISLAE
jgi:predicted nucleotidyltransferase